MARGSSWAGGKASDLELHYPLHLAEFVHQHWPQGAELPSVQALSELLSLCFQASLLTEEREPVTFRVVLLEPDQMPAADGPPGGYHRMRFTRARALVPNALRKLSPAAEFSHSLLGIRQGVDGFEIWGVVHSGPRWFNSFYNSRRAFQPLPNCLVVSVQGPGNLSVSNGSLVVARLSGGHVSAPGRDVLASRWLRDVFQSVRSEMADLMEESGPRIDPQIARRLSQTMLRRCLQLLSQQGQGGALLIVPPDMAGLLELPNPFFTIRYQLEDEEPRRRFRSLLIRLMQRLAALLPEKNIIGWHDYLAQQDQPLRDLDEGLEEFSQLLANLASVDGAVLLTHRMEILGFGVEIAGNLPAVHYIRRAKDIEAQRTVEESTEEFGTRHRSAYRLCAQLDQVLALIHSQDGRIQLVKQWNGHVTVWDQLATGARDL